MSVDQIVTKIKHRLEAVYGGRLKGIVLYGSAARGSGTEDSDIDILVLLEHPVELGKDLETIIDSVYPVQLETPHPIHATPVDIDTYEAGEYALYRNAKREGTLV